MFKSRRATWLLLTPFLICTILSGTILAQEEMIDVRRIMTAEEWDMTGLSKLSREEVEIFNRWLTSYTFNIIELAEKRQAGILPEQEEVIESRIKGSFNGWDGETIFNLQNGQVWQQDSFAYLDYYAFSPRVTIYAVGSSYKMKVEGVSEEIYVKRIK